MFRPSANQFVTPVRVQNRVETVAGGVRVASYVDAEPPIALCAWKGRGGSEDTSGGTLTIDDTAEVTLWYRPDIRELDRLLLHDDAKRPYEVINAEDVEQRHQFLVLKVSKGLKERLGAF